MNLDAKVNALIAADTTPGAAPEEPAKEAPAVAAPPEKKAAPPPSQADVFAAKLAEVNERRAASVALKQARAQQSHAAKLAAEAQADRDAAAAERAAEKARWDGIKSGSFLEGIKAQGRDPAVAFREMQDEAIRAGTPEAKIDRMREEFTKQIGETVEPLKKTIEELTRERDAAQAGAAERGFASDFSSEVTSPEFAELRVEYPDEQLLQHAKNFRDDPKFFYDIARKHAVRLTNPAEGFTMRDILTVLQSVQDAHREGIETRRAALAPPSPIAAQPPAKVNGATPRGSDAGQTIGNDLTTARAADGKFVPRGQTAAQRIRERARHFGGE